MRLGRDGSGYVLHTDPERIDVHRFDALLRLEAVRVHLMLALYRSGRQADSAALEVRAAPRQLPHDIANFTGRDEELARRTRRSMGHRAPERPRSPSTGHTGSPHATPRCSCT